MTVVTVVSGLVSVVALAYHARALEQRVEAQAASTARAVEGTLRTVMLNKRGDLAAAAVARLRELPDLKRIDVYRRDGTPAFTDLATLFDVMMVLSGGGDHQRAAELQAHFAGVERPLKSDAARIVDRDFADTVARAVPLSRHETLAGEPVLTYLLPLRNDRSCQECHGRDHAVRGVVMLSVPTTSLRAGVRDGTVLLVIALIATTVATGVALVLSLRARVLRPVEALVEALRAERPEQVLAHLRIPTREFQTLGDALRHYMSERRRAEEELRRSEAQLQHAQKMEAIGQLAGGIAHDFNNVLTIVAGRAEILRSRLPVRDGLARHASAISDAITHASKLVRQLLAFSCRQVLEPKVIDLNAVVAGIVELLRPTIGGQVDVTTSLAPELWPVRADPAQIEQVVLNLVVNARDAMPDGGSVTIETANVEKDSELGASVSLAVRDTGHGMDAATRSRIFEPFFTTKPADRGTGLGLAMVYGIVVQSGGKIVVDSEPGSGTTFTIRLPRVADPGLSSGYVPPSVSSYANALTSAGSRFSRSSTSIPSPSAMRQRSE